MARLLHPRPMSEFDPDRPSRVHDQLNDKIIDWNPTWRLAGSTPTTMSPASSSGMACC